MQKTFSVIAIRKGEDEDSWLGEDVEGQPVFAPLGPRTMIFHPEDRDLILGALAASPAGVVPVALRMELGLPQ